MFLSFCGKVPRNEGAAVVAPNATVQGDVILKAGSTVRYGAVLRGGDLLRLVDPEPNGLGAAWMITAKDGSEAAVFAVGDALTGSHGVASANSRPRLMLEGLDPAAQYTDEDANTYSGVQLLTTGLELPGGWGQTPAKIWYLKKV